MATIGAYEAKTKFSELLNRVEAGESVTITKHGRAVAELRPAPSKDRTQAIAAAQRLRKLSDEANVTDVTWEQLKKWMAEGRR